MVQQRAMSEQDVILLAEKLAELRRDAPHSVELTKNAKGDYQWSIKVYFGEEDPVDRIDTIDAYMRNTYLKEETERIAEAFELGVERGRTEQRKPLGARA